MFRVFNLKTLSKVAFVLFLGFECYTLWNEEFDYSILGFMLLLSLAGWSRLIAKFKNRKTGGR